MMPAARRVALTAAMVTAIVGGCGGSDRTQSQAVATTPAATTPAATTPAAATCPPRSITLEAAADGSFILPTLPVDDAAFSAAIADSFCSPTWVVSYSDGTEQTRSARIVLPSDEAACIGDRLMDAVGATRLDEFGLGRSPWGALGFGLYNSQTDRPIERGEAEAIVDVFEKCSDSWKLLLILSVTEGADKISDESARCVSDRLADDDARTMLVGEIDRAPGHLGDLIAPLVAAFDECLTPSELDNLDFN